MKTRFVLAAAALAALAGTPAARAAAGEDILKSQCVACHAIARQDTTAEAMLQRKGPPLYYAGVKFNKDWLTTWLQNPTVLRQGGAMYTLAVKAGADGPDTIDPARVAPHPRLSGADAASVTAALMTLGVADNAVAKGVFKGDPVNSMASLLFNKLRGCASCHSIKPGVGGISGPDLATAGDRLQPDYVVEYLRDPQKFDPHVWMPRLDLNDGDVQKLASYLMAQKQGAQK
jgi:mono/diheme cytochrome c family protein